jgi:hypothetical protein
MPATASYEQRLCKRCGARYQIEDASECPQVDSGHGAGKEVALVLAGLILIGGWMLWRKTGSPPEAGPGPAAGKASRTEPVAAAPAAAQPGGWASRNWRLRLREIGCTPTLSLLSVRADVQYIGPTGIVEAPVLTVADAEGNEHAPGAVGMPKDAAPEVQAWAASVLGGGGARRKLVSGTQLGTVESQFPLPAAVRGLRLHFADIEPFPVANTSYEGLRGLCRALAAGAGADRAPTPGPKAASGGKTISMYAGMYPCNSGQATRMSMADYPPDAPVQVLTLGKGFLPSARAANTNQGRVPARGYMYNGPEDAQAVKEFAREMIAGDFPQYCSSLALPAGGSLFRGEPYYAALWQRTRFRDFHVVGIYAQRPCEAGR